MIRVGIQIVLHILTFTKQHYKHFLHYSFIILRTIQKIVMRRSYSILYVDDDIDDLFLISEAFEKYTNHLTVVHADNGAEGLKTLEKLQENLPCLLIIDINMPVMDGKEMLVKLREDSKFKDLPVIMFSTSGSQKDKQFAEDYEAEFISKPASYSELRSLVEQFVSKCRFDVKSSA